MAGKQTPLVHVSPQFQRSVRVDADFERSDALMGYICQPSSRQTLSAVAHHVANSQQRAFTWTGPYGSGKSSLALALAQLAGGNARARKAAREALKIENGDAILSVFGRKPWLVLPVVGRRGAADVTIGEVIDRWSPRRGPKPMRNNRRDVIGELVKRAESGEHAGVLLVLDELGKFLEAAVTTGDDIFFYQELAEAASRCKGRLVIVGVLHQSFDQYALRAGRETQTEWAKVQGRFVDVPFISGIDEVIELIGGAICSQHRHPMTRPVAEAIGSAIRERRPSSPATLASSLDKCWPLHPVTAALLGPCSRRKFGQNERSVFGFLSSPEPLGFREFLEGIVNNDVPYYYPSRYWDYLRANFEPAILSSTDGHRWALVADSVERAEARFSEPHVSLVKTAGLIELFRNGSGVSGDTEVLAACIESVGRKVIDAALDELTKASILVYRKHLRAWGVYAGSDFDVEAAVNEARQVTGGATESQLRKLAMLPPLSARRHYWETGTLRWFERSVMLGETASAKLPKVDSHGSAGRFILLLPSADHPLEKTQKLAKALSSQHAQSVTLFGVPVGRLSLVERAAELSALTHVAESHRALHGDSVARREVDARLQQMRGELEDALRDAFSHSRWYFDGHVSEVKADEGLSPLASQVCDRVFHGAPKVFSELINRDVLSSNAAKAQRALMHRMINYGDRPNLDYSGYPVDAGLYYTTIAQLGLHRLRKGQGVFVAPEPNTLPSDDTNLHAFWTEVRQRLQSSQASVSLANIYELGGEPPFGIKRGLLPILALAFLLTHRSEIGVYVEGMFTPDLNDAGVDEWLQEPARISWKWVHMDENAKQLLTKLSSRLEQETQRSVAADPLDSARALVSLAMSLPAWTQRTQRLSVVARDVRTTLLRATDPLKVIFVDLPELLGVGRDPKALVDAVGRTVDELQSAYPAELARIAERMLSAIDHTDDLTMLHERAKSVNGLSGDFKLDAFAGRLESYAGSDVDIEGLVSLATNKPSTAFSDHDLDAAAVQLSKWAFEFRRIEALASVQGHSASRRALAVVFGSGTTVSATFDVALKDGATIQKLADALLDRLSMENIRPDVFLAALAEAGARVLELQRKEVV